MKLVVTAADRDMAFRLLAAFVSSDVATIAAILAEFREVNVSCAVARMEREFEVTLRKQREMF